MILRRMTSCKALPSCYKNEQKKLDNLITFHYNNLSVLIKNIRFRTYFFEKAAVAELADALDSKSSG